MLQICDSSINDLNLKLSSPSSGITLGLTFTPLKDLASSPAFINQAESVSCSNEPSTVKCCRSLFVDSEIEPKSIEMTVKKKDPTQKASELLTKALLEQKMHAAKKRKFEPTSIRSRPSSRRQNPFIKRTTKVSVESEKMKNELKNKSEKIAANNKKLAKKAKIAHENSSKTTVNLDFGNLKMAPLEHYKIPMCISDIENKIVSKIDARYLTSIETNINNSASDPEQYTQAYAALLYFIETAESITLQEFNEKYIRLSYSKIGKTFQIENAVSLKL